jgi:FAD/FMN-containing dehydrogenase
MATDLFAPTLDRAAPCVVVRPGDPGYDAARSGFNLAVSQLPAAVAFPSGAADVAALVALAREAGLRVAVQGGAHNAGPQGDLRDALLIRTTRMDGVHLDPAARRARVEAGVLWKAVVDAAAPHGLYPLHGSSPDVGVVGYSLGGGLGWLARSHGLQADRVTAVELVDADGELRRVDAEHDPELLWALRGGGGNFGVVTALEFELVALREAYAGWLTWDWTQAERVLRAWAAWTATAPETATTTARILQLPPLPELPEPLRGRRLVVIDGALTGDAAAAAALLAPLRALGPEIDTFATVPAPALVRLHGDPEEPVPWTSATTMLRELPDEAIATLVATAGPGSGSALLVAELRHLGGALGRRAPGAGAVSGFDAAYLLYTGGMAPIPEAGAVVREQARALVDALGPWAGGRAYLSFAESTTDPATAFDAAGYARLRAVRARVDPDGLFRANHEVPPAG